MVYVAVTFISPIFISRVATDLNTYTNLNKLFGIELLIKHTKETDYKIHDTNNMISQKIRRTCEPKKKEQKIFICAEVNLFILL